jgi:hypothetical protein
MGLQRHPGEATANGFRLLLDRGGRLLERGQRKRSRGIALRSLSAPEVEGVKLPRLNAAQVAGGALAAVTSAVAASRFGVAGTLIGCGLASVVSTTGTTVY